MAHQRANIRAAVVAAVTGLATTGANVVAGRVYPEDTSLLPALSVMTPEEEWVEEGSEFVEPVAGAVPTDRALTVEVHGHAAGATYLDTLDQIALEVETALNADLTLGGVCDAMLYAGAEIEQSDALEQPSGHITITYRAEYRTDARDPQTNQ